MTNNTDRVLIWLKEFQHNWLPENLSNDIHLLELVKTKLRELERLLSQNHSNDNRISIEYEYQCAELTDNPIITEQAIVPSEQLSKHSFPTPPDMHNQINIEIEDFTRPAIRLKRISLADAERFLPSAWKTTKSKRGRKKSKKLLSTINSSGKKYKKNTQPKKLAPTPDETLNITQKSTRSRMKSIQLLSSSSLASTQSTTDDKKKSKRKLRALDAEDDDLYTLGNLSQADNQHFNNDCEQISRYIGQNGILSQTRKTNETTIDDNDDFTIKLHSRRSNKTDISPTKFFKHPSDGVINATTTESSLIENLTIVEDVAAMDEEQNFKDMIESNDHESLFASLDMAHDRTLETSSPIVNNNSIINYNDCIEDISNDGIDVPPSSSTPNLDYLSLTMPR